MQAIVHFESKLSKINSRILKLLVINARKIQRLYASQMWEPAYSCNLKKVKVAIKKGHNSEKSSQINSEVKSNQLSETHLWAKTVQLPSYPFLSHVRTIFHRFHLKQTLIFGKMTENRKSLVKDGSPPVDKTNILQAKDVMSYSWYSMFTGHFMSHLYISLRRGLYSFTTVYCY